MSKILLVLGAFWVFSMVSCKKVPTESAIKVDGAGSPGKYDGSNSGESLPLMDLNPATEETRPSTVFECLDLLRPYSQGYATAFQWPDQEPGEEEKNTAKTYNYAIVILGNDSEGVGFFIEDEKGRVHSLDLSSSEKKDYVCADDDDLYCIKFRLPNTDKPLVGTSFQIFETEALVANHGAVKNFEADYKSFKECLIQILAQFWTLITRVALYFY